VWVARLAESTPVYRMRTDAADLVRFVAWK
jgi:hypothetical protein